MGIRYLRQTTKGGWQFKPTGSAIRAGVASYWYEKDGRSAKARAVKDNQTIDQWRAGTLAGHSLLPSSTMAQVAAHYMRTSHFQTRKTNTQKSYRYMFGRVSDAFGSTPITKINVAKCQTAYDEWVKVSPANAQSLCRGVSLLFSHAMAYEIVVRNPMMSVKKITPVVTSVLWTQKDVEAFVATAFTKWKWRNVGLVAALCYEYAQRPVDIANLTWNDIDYSNRVLTITQEKRGATVRLPIDDYVLDLLKQQEVDFGFQEFVLPNLRPSDGAYRPYDSTQTASIAQDIIEEAQLSADLKLGKLRNTAINEMVESGVDSAAIMNVTGHQNIESLNPYLKHTLRGSTSALTQRKKS